MACGLAFMLQIKDNTYSKHGVDTGCLHALHLSRPSSVVAKVASMPPVLLHELCRVLHAGSEGSSL